MRLRGFGGSWLGGKERKKEEMDIGMRWRTDDVTLPAFFHCFQSTLGRLYFFSYIFFRLDLEVLRYMQLHKMRMRVDVVHVGLFSFVKREGWVSGRA